METTTDTREALLDAAESLFAEHGVQAASLRAITQQAGANLAAVHYHFGSKEGLVRAVFSRRIGPLNEERLRRLEECEREGRGVNRAIGSVIIGGQTLALLLTLIGTPVAYSLFDDVVEARIFGRLGERLRRMFRRREPAPAA